jgi:predicted PurR-regulated permease PerM
MLPRSPRRRAGWHNRGARVNPNAPARSIVRTVLIVVGVVAALYVLYLLRKPLTWLFIAAFVAVALSGPVNVLARRMRRGLAITIVYLGLLLVPVFVGALIVPPIVEEASQLIDEAPQYADDIEKFVNENKTLRTLNEDYDITTKIQEEANKLPDKIGDAAGVLRDIGFGLVNSIFALITILVMTAFLLGSGRGWIDQLIALQPPQRRDRLRRVLEHVSTAVSGYVAGALAQATIAAVTTYILLWILGVDFRAPLALLIFFFDLIPLVGATIGAVLVGLVTLFTDFPTATIIWVIYSIVYQQVENNVIQPQIQKRTVNVHPFLALMSVLFGATLLGILGALLAIPVAASIQIAVREWWTWRMETIDEQRAEALREGEPPPAPKILPEEPPSPPSPPAPEGGAA